AGWEALNRGNNNGSYAYIPAFRVEKLCCYLAFTAGFLGARLFSFDVVPGFFVLFPQRILLLVLWGLLVIRTCVEGRVTLPQARTRSYLAFFAVWMTYAMLSVGWAAAKGQVIRHSVVLFTGVSLLFLVTYYLRDRRVFKDFYLIWFWAFCGLIILGFWEHLTGVHLPSSRYHDYPEASLMYLPMGVFYNPNDYATFLSISTPFALSLARYAGARLAGLIGIGTTLAAFYLIVVTASRANILAVLLVLGFLLFFLTRLKQKVKAAFGVLVLLAIALFVLPGPIQDFSSRVATELDSIVGQAELEYGSVAIRANLIRNGLEFVWQTAGLGVGAGNAEYWMANFARYDTRGIISPHNWWLEILINYGVFVFVGYVAVYLSILWRLWRAWRKAANREERMIAEALLLSLIGFSVASISSSSIMAFNPNWMLFAFALAFLNYSLRRGSIASPNAPKR
ncbi:MAG: O-antigen ligase family protein, partial [Anaerolineae bacterium]